MKLSIITINKNNALGLEKTCISVSIQTYKNIEWLIIDGASNDNSINIIKEFSSHIHYWVSEPDSGIYNAMNKGIKHSTGEYILFLNSGDFLIHPWTIHDLVNEINSTEYADFYFSDTITTDYQVISYPKILTLDFFLNGTINHQNCIIKRELFIMQLYDENFRIKSDYFFYLTNLLLYKKIFIHINTHISFYDLNGFSMNNAVINKIEQDEIIKRLSLPTYTKTENKDENPDKNIVINKKSININIILKYILPYGIYLLIKKLLVFIR